MEIKGIITLQGKRNRGNSIFYKSKQHRKDIIQYLKGKYGYEIVYIISPFLDADLWYNVRGINMSRPARKLIHFQRQKDKDTVKIERPKAVYDNPNYSL